MKGPDLDKERSEMKISIKEFLQSYNSNIPAGFPRATMELLITFSKTYPALFKAEKTWTLGQHRKKFMDWLQQYLRSI
jgi:hypothetical protein